MFIQVDGIDGAGKSTLLKAATAWAATHGLRVFDADAWSEECGRIPTLEDVGEADMLLTAEPTHAWIGAAIRQEVIRDGTPYDARFAAVAFSLDRGVQYTRLILPFLAAKPNRWVIQDRGVLSSLAYQPLQSEREGSSPPVTPEWLRSLDGNRLAIEHAPDAFVFVDVDAAIAQGRLAGRADKVDGDRFETSDFQAALAERYRDPATSVALTERGTKLIILDGKKTKDGLAADMTTLLEEMAT
ncbi:hypothetical protein KJ781_02100 [Patescibacteria group bacterium]|nr:hypothetical protein [Patescibacteria group bacterium]MBU1448942.1 hypothetical protein [Patescibacteria group bacterium]